MVVGTVPVVALAQSPFDGTWRPDPQHFDASRPPDAIQLKDHEYSCQSCMPPYKVVADGTDRPVSFSPRFDSLRIEVQAPTKVHRIAKKKGTTVFESTMQVSADGQTLTERQIMSDAGPHVVDFTARSSRVSPVPAGAHAISGSWRLVEADLTNHDEDTDYRISDGVLTMSDRMGRSFKAKLDGTDAPYKGDSQFTSVSVKQIDPLTLEETDKAGAQAVKVTQWKVDADGKTMHVRFDDTHGHVQEQTGHKVVAK
jgi:hypothetical protein